MESCRKPWSQSEVNQLLVEVMGEAASLGIPYSRNIHPNIIINKRAKRRFGCCKKIKRGLKIGFEIELSHRLLYCDKKMVMQILAHELLHTCPRCDNHGSSWKAYAEKWNTAFGYQIKRTGSPEELDIENNSTLVLPKENYLVICKNCGTRIARARMSPVVKYPHHYRCKCGGKLERVK